jgi:hypothetical protein
MSGGSGTQSDLVMVMLIPSTIAGGPNSKMISRNGPDKLAGRRNYPESE